MNKFWWWTSVILPFGLSTLITSALADLVAAAKPKPSIKEN